jgi:hypothetical protein
MYVCMYVCINRYKYQSKILMPNSKTAKDLQDLRCYNPAALHTHMLQNESTVQLPIGQSESDNDMDLSCAN